MQRYWITFIFLLWSNSAFCWHYPTHDFCADDTQISYLHDSDDSLSPKEAITRLRKKTKTKSPQTLNYGYTKGRVWLYLNVKEAKGLQKCVLELANPQLDEIKIHQIIDGKSTHVATMGDQFPFTDRFYRVRNYVFPFRADINQEFLVSLKSTATMTVPIKVQWRDQFVNDSSLDYLHLGLFYGLMLCFIFFGLHSFLSFKEKAFAIYALFAISMLFFFIDRDGISYQYFWPNSTFWKLRSARVFAAIAMAFGVLYVSQILRLRHRWLQILAYSYVGFSSLLAFVLLFLDPGLTNVPTILVSLGTPILMVLLPISTLKTDRIFAPSLLGAGLCSSVGLALYALSVTNKIDSSYLTDNAMKISTVIEFVFLTMGIHNKIKHTMRKKALHKAVFEISNMLAHDIRSPLDKMDKFLSNLKKVSPTQLPHYLEASSSSIKKDIHNADAMLSDLTAMGKNQSNSSESDLAKIIPQACNGRYKYDLGYDGFVRTDGVNLKRIFDNLTKNAIQATTGTPGCKFWINSKDIGKFVQISVGNTGSTIGKEDLSKVFSIFYTRGKKKGTGIGLAFVEKVVKENKGKLWVESNGYSSSGKKVKNSFSGDYVEFHLTLPKGNGYESY